MPAQQKYGTVNLYGVGAPDNSASNFNGGNGQKEGWSPDRNQTLRLSPDAFRYTKNGPYNPNSASGQITPSRHETIKGYLSEGMKRKEAVKKAKDEDKHNITKAEVYRHKYQNTGPQSPFSSQSQESPY